MSITIPQEMRVRKETLLESALGKATSSVDDTPPSLSPVQIRSLQTRMESLEQQMKKAVHTLAEREHYVNALAIDLEHIILQLVNKLDKNTNSNSLLST